MTAIAKREPEKLMLRIEKGAFLPADGYTASRLRERGYHTGELVGAIVAKLRNPRFNRLVHRIGQLCAANLGAFSGMDAHQVIKRVQLESGIACDETAIRVPGLGMVMHRTPRSLSFESMDDGEFHDAARGLCRWIAAEYWPTLSAEQVQEMAESFVGDT